MAEDNINNYLFIPFLLLYFIFPKPFDDNSIYKRNKKIRIINKN